MERVRPIWRGGATPLGLDQIFFRHSLFWGLLSRGGGAEGNVYQMSKYTFPSAVILGAVSILSFSLSAQANTFGSGSNSFEISFVQISQTNNATDPRTTNKYGAVPYEYRAGIYEISQNGNRTRARMEAWPLLSAVPTSASKFSGPGSSSANNAITRLLAGNFGLRDAEQLFDRRGGVARLAC